jgi:hypothetical protein
LETEIRSSLHRKAVTSSEYVKRNVVKGNYVELWYMEASLQFQGAIERRAQLPGKQETASADSVNFSQMSFTIELKQIIHGLQFKLKHRINPQ